MSESRHDKQNFKRSDEIRKRLRTQASFEDNWTARRRGAARSSDQSLFRHPLLSDQIDALMPSV
jgi:hypothetical protein